MKLRYLMDVEEDTVSTPHTPVPRSGLFPFVMTNTGYMNAKSGYFTEREGLDSFQLIYTLEGSGYLKHGNEDYFLRPGQAVLINCNEYHFYKTSEEGFWKFKWIHFNGSSCLDYSKLINGSSLSVITISSDLSVESDIDGIKSLSCLTGVLIDAKIANIITGILTQLLANKLNISDGTGFTKQKKDIDKVIGYIQHNYSTSISINGMAKQVLLSKYHFSRVFKAHTGLGPYEYLMNYRINISKSLLRNTFLTVTEISERSGFGDVNNFIKFFKRLEGMTPSKYRQYWID